jgi:hypothetical protein
LVLVVMGLQVQRVSCPEVASDISTRAGSESKPSDLPPEKRNCTWYGTLNLPSHSARLAPAPAPKAQFRLPLGHRRPSPNPQPLPNPSPCPSPRCAMGSHVVLSDSDLGDDSVTSRVPPPPLRSAVVAPARLGLGRGGGTPELVRAAPRRRSLLLFSGLVLAMVGRLVQVAMSAAPVPPARRPAGGHASRNPAALHTAGKPTISPPSVRTPRCVCGTQHSTPPATASVRRAARTRHRRVPGPRRSARRVPMRVRPTVLARISWLTVGDGLPLRSRGGTWLDVVRSRGTSG